MTGAGASRKETVHMGNARNRNPCPESAPAHLCHECRYWDPETSHCERRDREVRAEWTCYGFAWRDRS